MGSRAVHCGDAGAGQAAKICNNMVLGISMSGVCEAFALADRLGLDAGALYDVVSTSSGQCWSVTSYGPVTLRRARRSQKCKLWPYLLLSRSSGKMPFSNCGGSPHSLETM